MKVTRAGIIYKVYYVIIGKAPKAAQIFTQSLPQGILQHEWSCFQFFKSLSIKQRIYQELQLALPTECLLIYLVCLLRVHCMPYCVFVCTRFSSLHPDYISIYCIRFQCTQSQFLFFCVFYSYIPCVLSLLLSVK